MGEFDGLRSRYQDRGTCQDKDSTTAVHPPPASRWMSAGIRDIAVLKGEQVRAARRQGTGKAADCLIFVAFEDGAVVVVVVDLKSGPNSVKVDSLPGQIRDSRSDVEAILAEAGMAAEVFQAVTATSFSTQALRVLRAQRYDGRLIWPFATDLHGSLLDLLDELLIDRTQ